MTGTQLFSTFCTQSTPDSSVAEHYGYRNSTCLFSKEGAKTVSNGHCIQKDIRLQASTMQCVSIPVPPGLLSNDRQRHYSVNKHV
jgi:hypothetical protein